MTAGWAATNTLRHVTAFAWDNGLSFETKDKADAALALVETALDAAERRAEEGHSDDCATLTGTGADPCTCGFVALAAALRAVREGQ